MDYRLIINAGDAGIISSAYCCLGPIHIHDAEQPPVLFQLFAVGRVRACSSAGDRSPAVLPAPVQKSSFCIHTTSSARWKVALVQAGSWMMPFTWLLVFWQRYPAPAGWLRMLSSTSPSLPSLCIFRKAALNAHPVPGSSAPCPFWSAPVQAMPGRILPSSSSTSFTSCWMRLS